MQQKKGQAAMEFLMTYGWAILAAIVAIGVLAYFGVFSPGKIAGSNAIVNNPFYAASWQVNTTDANLELLNNGGDTVKVYNVTVTGSGTSTGTVCGGTGYFGLNTISMDPGAQKLIVSHCTGTALTVGNNFAGNIQIQYFKSGSALNQSATGTIRAAID